MSPDSLVSSGRRATGRRRSPLTLLAAFAAAIGLLTAIACGRGHEPGRVLLLGIDGATMTLIEPMMAQGRLPNLARLSAEGAAGVLSSETPLFSPRIWTSIATGKHPNQHGIVDFVHPGVVGKKKLMLSHDRRSHALWNIASDAGLSVGVVNWWTTYPPEHVRGVIVSDHFIPSVVEGRMAFFGARGEFDAPTVYPEEWGERVRELVRDEARIASLPNNLPTDQALPSWVDRGKVRGWYQDDARVATIALDVEAKLRPDVLMLILKGVDAMSHVLWASIEAPKKSEPRFAMTEPERRGGAKALRDYYEYADSLLGRLVERYGEDDLIMVVSDHGFQLRHRFRAGLTGGHKRGDARNGIFFARGPGFPAGIRAEQIDIYDIAPTILAWLQLPLPEDMKGEPASFLEVPEVARIETYDTTPIVRSSAEESGQEEEILEQLQALGYFEDDARAETESEEPLP